MSDQEIFFHKNTARLWDLDWDRDIRDFRRDNILPPNDEIFDEPIILGVTNESGILRVNIDQKVGESGYDLTFSDY